ncbi:MAG: glycosyl hydrolase family 18 protein [Chloroflexota bacterium]
MRFRLSLLAVLVAVALGAFGAYSWLRGTEGASSFDQRRNGIWLDVVWTSRPHDDGEVAALSDDLVDKGFRYAYVYVNSVQASGEPVASTYAYAKPFVAAAKRAQPELRLIAWIGVVNAVRGQGKVPIDEPDVRDELAAFAAELTGDLGFDGVQLNVEPLPNGDESFLDLLLEVRSAIGPRKTLAIAGHKWAPDFVPLVERYSSYWKPDYYRQVASLVDQVAVMTYDSYSPTAEAYRLFQREQTVGVLGSVEGTDAEVLIGVPTYDEPRLNHNPGAENIDTGLHGVVDALARLDASARQPFAGVALYAHWETDAKEWETYRSVWEGRQP